ncbi:hypothetical protein K458DRAFT_298418 [Lentithecium fluviatile CBS 122367]|uniref:Uncharacterized protein n=1 Tax=Lentithecium fluviatile CBS 122367 TaxID=1168545 RepID=A0A6G1J7Z6_9PLEO|nr:hypothetical protein K458DRAFT_298418 [Lentithecium fluviatile CBS 122367]
MGDPADDTHHEEDAYRTAKASRFQFKSRSEKRSKRRHREHEGGADEGHPSKRSRSDKDGEPRRHRPSKRRHKQRSDYHRSFSRTGDYEDPDHRYRESLYDGLEGEGAGSPKLDPETAFRESLFDALADDEGADYWEGVYGQPVHIYPSTKPGPDGKLERMSEEEYAEFVRTKMWEKSHQHILEERAARERARQQKRKQHENLQEDVSREGAEREKVMRQMEESLRRGEQRKKAKEAEASWMKYLSKWEHLKGNPPSPETEQGAQDIIPWPVASGRATHVDKEEIERFLRASHAWKDDAASLLKIERVRWHPDKMQQRFGGHIDPDTMKLVTAVFQVVDHLWNERSGHRK